MPPPPPPPPPLLFLYPAPLRLSRPLPVAARPARASPSACQTQPPRSAHSWPAPQSSALKQDTAADRYIDLHTMQLIHASSAHLCDAPHPTTSFGLFDTHPPLSDAAHTAHIRELLFTPDTVPLSEPQKDVVQALLSRRSALFVAPNSHHKHPVLLDIFFRSGVWKELVVYCADSPRAAEAAYTLVCAQLPADRHHEVQLHLDSLPHASDPHADRRRLIITSPQLVRSALADCDRSSWLQDTAIFFVDTLTLSNAAQWEEILLALPSRILLCVFTADLPHSDHQLLPLWMETIQNSIISVTPSREASFLHRIENPQHSPLLRSFAYNAALHESPVQVSLTLLKEMFDDSSKLSFVPKYSECFLHGIKMIPTESPSTLLFRSTDEAKFADIAALVVADAKAARKKSRKKRGRPSKPKERTASSRAAAKKRRDAAYEASLLSPAIAFVSGRDAAENAACAVQSALGDELSVLWDDDSREHVEDIVSMFKAANEGQLSATDVGVLDVLVSGIGVVHAGLTPGVRLIIEELFRAGFLPIICADSFLGSSEISALPCAKSILIDASVIGVCDDATKGLVSAATVAALAGRAQKDDVGNLVFLWYDEAVDDETAGYEISSTLLHHLFWKDGNEYNDYSTSLRMKRSAGNEFEEHAAQKPDCVLSSSYGGVLRSVRRFGTDGYETIFEYTLNSYRGWLERAAIRATLERLEVEKTAISSRLEAEDWGSIAEHERREAKVNELRRVLKAMETRYAAVLEKRTFNDLRRSSPGRLIGVVVTTGEDNDALMEQRLLLGGPDEARVAQNGAQDAGGREAAQTSGLVASENGASKKERVVSAVFVALLDQDVDGKRIAAMESQHLVVCILADGLWTIVPLSDVVALADEGEDVVPNVDLLMMPHPATFDLDPRSQHSTCRAIDRGEQEAVGRISDELIARMASDRRPELVPCRIEEFEAQKGRMQVAERLYKQSAWHGRDAEVIELRRLRRREAKLSDEIEWLQKRENQLEEELFNKHNEQRCNQQAIMAVLEDCHAVAIQGDCSMVMTAIGALGSVLPSEFPLFAGACLCLIDEVSTLSQAQFASLVALVVCGEGRWKAAHQLFGGGDEQGDAENDFRAEASEKLDLSVLNRQDWTAGDWSEQSTEVNAAIGDELSVLGLPERMKATVMEIWQALNQLHRRHHEEGEEGMWSVSEIVPQRLNTEVARAIGRLAEGENWAEAVRTMGDEAAYLSEELRRTMAALQVMAQGGGGDEESELVQCAADALQALHGVRGAREPATWALGLGVVERAWAGGNSYDRWWRATRDALLALSGDDGGAGGEEVATATATGAGRGGELVEPS